MVKSINRKRSLSESNRESEGGREEEVSEEKTVSEINLPILKTPPHPSSSSVGDETSKESLKISLKLPTMKRRESSTDERHILKICLKKPIEKKDDESVSSSMNGSDEESIPEGVGMMKTTPSRHPRPKDLYQAMMDCLHVFTK